MEVGWNALAEATDARCIYLRHEWYRAAWKWRERDRAKLFVLTVRRDDTLVAVLPLVKAPLSPLFGRLAVSIESLTIPDSQRFEVLCHESDLEESAEAIGRFLATGAGRWDVLRVDYLGDARRAQVLEAALRRHGMSAQVGEGHTCLSAPLTNTWPEYYGRRTRRLKKGNNLISNHLQRDFEKIEILRSDGLQGGGSLVEAVSKVVDLSSRSWKSETGTSFAEPGPRAWLDELELSMADKGWLVVWGLLVNGQWVATELQVEYRGSVSAMRADIDPKFVKHSPGTYLSWKILEQLMDTGRITYNMGPGENEYKLRWSEGSQQLFLMTCFNRSVAGWMLERWRLKWRPALRSARDALSRSNRVVVAAVE